MPEFWIVIFVLLVVFLSAFARSAVGFGNALIGMPLLTLLVGIRMATPLVGLLAVVMSAVILLDSWREVEFQAARRLVLASFVGVPIGVWLVRSVPEGIVTTGLGVLLIGFASFSLARPQLPSIEESRWSYFYGGLAGMLGAAYNTSGPPIVVYGALRHWPPVHFRATLQGFFLPSTISVAISHGLGGLWNREVFVLLGLSLPVMVAAVVVGGWVNRRLDPARFVRLLYGILIGLGILLIVQGG